MFLCLFFLQLWLYNIFLGVDILLDCFYFKIFILVINQIPFRLYVHIFQSGRGLLTLELWVEANVCILQQCFMSTYLNFSLGLMDELAKIGAHLTNGKDINKRIFASKG